MLVTCLEAAGLSCGTYDQECPRKFEATLVEVVDEDGENDTDDQSRYKAHRANSMKWYGRVRRWFHGSGFGSHVDICLSRGGDALGSSSNRSILINSLARVGD